MASSFDHENSSLTDTDDDGDSVFYDAISSLSTTEILCFQEEPRWRISSKNESSTKSVLSCTVSLTEKQLADLERVDKLRSLRSQDKSFDHTNQNIVVNASMNSISTESPSILSSSSPIEQQLKDADASFTYDHSKQNSKKSSASSLSKDSSINSARSSVLSCQLPAKSARGTGGYYSNKIKSSTNNESNMIDKTLIDRITKLGELSPNSPKLNDDEILRQPIVLNLDNGSYIPLSDTNPMMQTIMERTNRSGSVIAVRQNSFVRSRNSLQIHSPDRNILNKPNLNLSRQIHKSHDENDSTSSESTSTKSSHTTDLLSSSVTSKSSGRTLNSSISKRKQLTNLVLKNFLHKRKSKVNNDHRDIPNIVDDEDDSEKLLINDGDVKYKSSRYLRESAQFDKTQLLQTIVNTHNGPIWCMKFSPDGYFLATGGQDSLLKIWILKSIQSYFNNSSSTLNLSKQSEILTKRFNEFHQNMSTETATSTTNRKLGLHERQAPLYEKPFCELIGHLAPVLDVAWSKSLFLLSSSMDKTVRLWHLSRFECLCYFRHVDFVSAIAFHPRDDRYFVSASLDGHVRLWNIPDKRAIHWALIPTQTSTQLTAAEANLITAVNFCDDGRKVTVGTFDGRFLLYTDSLQYDTVINIGDGDGSRSYRTRRKRRKPFKITGIEPMHSNDSKVLITSNDSRIRLYDIRTKEIERKYRGYSNQSSQIRASFSHDDRYIISGSEDTWFYIWKREPRSNENISKNTKLTRKQRLYFDRAYERIHVHNAMVTSAIFAPNPVLIMNYLYSVSDSLPSAICSSTSIAATSSIDNNPTSSIDSSATANALISMNSSTYVMVTADSKGQLKLLVNRYHR